MRLPKWFVTTSLVIGMAVLILTIVAATGAPQTAPDLACTDINLVEMDPVAGSFVADNPNDVVLKTEWWATIGLPDASRRIVAGVTAQDGIAALSATSDGLVAAKDATAALQYQVYVSTEATARLQVREDESESYYLSGIAYCSPKSSS